MTFSEPIKGGWVAIYMDDVLLSSRTVPYHLQHLKKALQLLREKQWCVKTNSVHFSFPKSFS